MGIILTLSYSNQTKGHGQLKIENTSDDRRGTQKSGLVLLFENGHSPFPLSLKSKFSPRISYMRLEGTHEPIRNTENLLIERKGYLSLRGRVRRCQLLLLWGNELKKGNSLKIP